MAYNEEKWVCLHISESLVEANLLQALLKQKGFQVTVCGSPKQQHHDYLHDQQELVRIFVRAEDLQNAQHALQQFSLITQGQNHST